ncbi:hypothetical protein [Comamonas sp. JC664]|uniref:hypothetical protein n=1 Tax=Comamonas sp. JC664 TaxID=2801917 RepID=UPI001889FFE8|nr:hypothetical protein [Comamonas sp. JC664]MBL0692202.1 hypothetical protein [Comamonas sp. JC664]GHH04738.1 hypothetical protein GCM10012319_74270 [Comamonas sp. KCTC 72670]
MPLDLVTQGMRDLFASQVLAVLIGAGERDFTKAADQAFRAADAAIARRAQSLEKDPIAQATLDLYATYSMVGLVAAGSRNFEECADLAYQSAVRAVARRTAL